MTTEEIQDFLRNEIDGKIAEGDLSWHDDGTDLVRWCGRMAEHITKEATDGQQTR